MVISFGCFGQKKDSSYFIIGDVGGQPHGIAIFKSFGNEEYKQDTVKVLMLVCDTTGTVHGGMLFFNPQQQAFNEGRGVWWQFGYIVKLHDLFIEEPNPNYWGEGRSCLVGGCELDHSSKTIKTAVTYATLIYLDENKKALPKSIIVWLSKEIK